MATLLLALLTVTSVALIVSLFYVLKFARIILGVEEVIEVSLVELDNSYNRLSDILETPIFFDSLEVRRAVDEIAKTRELILEVAESLIDSIQVNVKEESDLYEEGGNS